MISSIGNIISFCLNLYRYGLLVRSLSSSRESTLSCYNIEEIWHRGRSVSGQHGAVGFLLDVGFAPSFMICKEMIEKSP